MTLRVVLEVAPKRAFASALDWPGWSRGGRTAEEATETLLEYAPRYADVARRARVPFPHEHTVDVVERVSGGGTTEFGVPAVPAAAEDEPIDGADLDRLVGLVRAAWETLDATARSVGETTLATGPRGGGRSVTAIVEHARDAERAYLGKLGSTASLPADLSATHELAALHDAFVAALRARATGRPVPNPNKTRKLWSPRYAARRSAWHALDHAWEIEDRRP